MATKKGLESEAPAASFWQAVGQVVDGLKRQPLFLLGFGIAILLLGAGALAIESLRLVAGGLLAILVVVLLAWIASLAIQIQREPGKAQRIRGGKNVIGDRAEVNDADVSGGKLSLSKDQVTQADISGGDNLIGKEAKITGGKIHGGDVEIK
jgi:membrane protein implicated in regulation of membrane protease activity